MESNLSHALDTAAQHSFNASGIPLSFAPSTDISFEIDEGKVQFRIEIRSREETQIALEVDSVFSSFATKTGTISLWNGNSNVPLVGTILGKGAYPNVAVHNGKISASTISDFLSRTDKWESVHPGSKSSFQDSRSFLDHRTYSFGADKDSTSLPERIVYNDRCVLCGDLGLSPEHCTPKWMTSKMSAIPVTAKLLCQKCNKRLGGQIEKPVSEAVTSGTFFLPEKRDLMAIWAIKTALFLSQASGVSVLQRYIRLLDFQNTYEPLKAFESLGFEVFFSTPQASVADGYIYTVTHFPPAEGDQGRFLFSFCGGGVAFLVCSFDQPRLRIPTLTRTFPDFRFAIGCAQPNIVALHHQVLTAATGQEIIWTPLETFAKPQKVQTAP